MKYSSLVAMTVAAAFAIAMGVTPAAAKSGGNTKVKTKVPTASAKPKPVKAPSTSNAAKAKPPKAKPAASMKPQTSSSAAAKSTKATKTAGKPTTSNEPTTGAKPVTSTNDLEPEPTPGVPGPALPLSKAQEKLLKNENLRAKMAERLGRDPLIAASGFKNLGQFVAAVNASNRLGIEFNTFKRLMVQRGLSLGQAIQQAKAMDAAGATRIANQVVIQADADIAGVN